MKKLLKVFNKENRSITDKGSWIYYSLFTILLIAILVIVSVNFITPSKASNIQTSLNKQIDLGADDAVTIESWQWNKKLNTMDIVLNFESEIASSENIKYNFKAYENRQPNDKKDLKVVSETANKKAVRIDNVTKGFEVMLLQIDSKSDSDDKLQEEVGMLYSPEKKVEILNNNKDKNEQQYQLFFIQNDIKNGEKNQEKIEKSIKNYDKKSDDKDTQISKLNQEKQYQNGEEKEQTESKISSLNSDKTNIELDRETKIDQLEEAKDKVKLLNKKLKDTELYID